MITHFIAIDKLSDVGIIDSRYQRRNYSIIQGNWGKINHIFYIFARYCIRKNGRKMQLPMLWRWIMSAKVNKSETVKIKENIFRLQVIWLLKVMPDSFDAPSAFGLDGSVVWNIYCIFFPSELIDYHSISYFSTRLLQCLRFWRRPKATEVIESREKIATMYTNSVNIHTD